MSEQIRDDKAARRFELEVDGQIVFADYRREGEVLVIRYVEAPPSLRGTGASGRLMRGVMEQVRREGLRVVPLCGYAASWIRAHKEYADLLD
ncbi:MAG: GNAT family N-acetyltransferase [Alphaproteobacteria bacterium]